VSEQVIDRIAQVLALRAAKESAGVDEGRRSHALIAVSGWVKNGVLPLRTLRRCRKRETQTANTHSNQQRE
jgi:hypothetical protein